MYYKILRSNLIHNGFVYKEGLNVLSEQFSYDIMCGPGGLYFTEDLYIFTWLTMYDPRNINDIYIAEVELTNDSQIVRMENKLKTDKFILKNIQTFGKFLDKNPHYILGLIRYIKYSGCQLLSSYDLNDWTSKLSDDSYRKAIDIDPSLLEFIEADKQTPDMCIKAIRKNPKNIFHVKDLAKILKAIKPENEKIIYISTHITARNILDRRNGGTYNFILMFNDSSPPLII
jgi:hypothetical protein